MILKDDGEIESDGDESKYESIPTLEDAIDVKYVVDSESMVIRISLNV
jgi:hypothetical protein